MDLDKIKQLIEEDKVAGKRESGQEVPAGYFDSLEQSLIEKIPEKTAITRRMYGWKISAVAASVAVLFSVVFLWNGTEEVTAPVAMTDVSAEESVNFLISINDRLENEDILELENIDAILEEMEQELDNKN